ncbi:adenine-specific methyltransferase EcoRI family protein [Rhodococcus sp. C3V]|uniref:adenine-specific methyltransferase EcoRI family protein n=1 Tax=Rhodococcus sp. C3V TaxID=3034165 RepID=UPI0023E30030|nr:adenine-specific methyltransferase EcoRI family protein [Rhodococcus sp. C3V]MDF3319905.1 adenine-specific methyltransferase EcoRI family protein [Rhodococcus sp. C3V]
MTTTIAAAKTSNLNAAKKARWNEYYTQWADIEREMNAYLDYDPDVFRDKVVLLPCDDPEWSNFAKYFALHFTAYGLKKLISTSYAPDANKDLEGYQPSLFEAVSPQFDATKSRVNGKMFVLTREDINGDGVVNIDDLQWEYLEGDGDFRSVEVTALRDDADIVITNPPFSLFREFVFWIVEAGKNFSIIGSSNATTYVEVFPLIRANEMWKGATANNTDMVFGVPKGAPIKEADKAKAAKLGYPSDDDYDYTRLGNSCWFTNIDHGRRHEPLQLMTMADNIKFSKRKEVRGIGYETYFNFPEAIEVPFVEAIPSDFDGIMGVPITFLDKYNPDQFEILTHGDNMDELRQLGVGTLGEEFVKTYYAQGGTGSNSQGHRRLGLTRPKYHTAFKRIMIRRKAEA